MNIFPYARRSHVSWTGESLCSQKKIDSVQEKLSFLIKCIVPNVYNMEIALCYMPSVSTLYSHYVSYYHY